jgi:hypothetical protein
LIEGANAGIFCTLSKFSFFRLRANLCNNPIYDALMRQQCPSTCRRCQQPSDSDFGEEEPTSGSDCVDRGPDCQKLPYLCENPVIIPFINFISIFRIMLI